MRRKSEKASRKQADLDSATSEFLESLFRPMIAGAVESREALFGMVQEAGLSILMSTFCLEAEKAAGPKGKHQSKRKANHWGSTTTRFPFAGRSISLDRPRVRSIDGEEISLPFIEELQKRDPIPKKVIEQIVLGVSTRGYDHSLPERPNQPTRGASKSAASRHIVKETKAKLAELRSSRLDDFGIIALMLDAVHVAGSAVIVAMGIADDGKKRVLGFYQGSTENSQICIELLQNLIGRGLRIDRRFLAVIDGSKALRKALDDVFGDQIVVQRCRIHKQRNLRGHLPEKRHAYVLKTMNEAYGSRSQATARKRLLALATWLENAGETTAANSLREGLDETLTVLGWNLTDDLCRFFSSTNAVENLIGSFRRSSRNVKRWRNPEMVVRWAAFGLTEAEKRFRKIRGYKDLGALAGALGWNTDHNTEEIAA